jgi:sugar phosphate isomerase/epimerase
MKLGAHTFGFVWQSSAEDALEAVAGAGFRNVQLMATPPHFDPWAADSARTKRLRAVLERHGLSLLALDLASSDINLASASADVVDFAVDAYARAIARASELGARWICVGSGRRHALIDRANRQLLETFRPAFARICTEARRLGVGVILENHPQGLLPDAKAIREFLERDGDEDVRVIYDVANAAAIGEEPIAGIEELWHHIGILHLSDSPKGRWRHDPIGTGDIDFRAIASLLERKAFDGFAVLEILSDEPLRGLVEGGRALKAAGLAFADPIGQAR